MEKNILDYLVVNCLILPSQFYFKSNRIFPNQSSGKPKILNPNFMKSFQNRGFGFDCFDQLVLLVPDSLWNKPQNTHPPLIINCLFVVSAGRGFHHLPLCTIYNSLEALQAPTNNHSVRDRVSIDHRTWEGGLQA